MIVNMRRAIIKAPRMDSRAAKTCGMCPAARFGWIFEYPKLVNVITLW
ncbi:MAG: hypothetical protein SBU_001215 [Candidatus Syntrophoarchaeum butanivorans]|uniref:Uncharacterized protein n=1 Tax=Candidatus Syntropharchaeum butanivorans TaxID=1839936 RepID=A0A1F2P530_9EURY|nr:MAG: hypothetical protein SBU_001215 [Candidatus Syntrophoarchaeum butanivorans]